MNVSKIFGIVIAVALGIASCKKGTVYIPVEKKPVAYKRITKSVETYSDGSKETYTLTYDAKGRPATYTSDTKKDVFNFQSPTMLLVSEYDLPGNLLSRTYECTLNELGAITQMIFKNTEGAITYTYTYTYNADGYMTGVKGSSGTSFFEEAPEIKDGNYIASKTTFSGGTVYNKQFFFSNVPNLQPGGFYHYWPLATLFGRPSKNLLVEAKTFQTNGNLYWHVQNHYTMSADGSVAKYTTDIVTSRETSVVELEYE